jgi:hypothetical protein
MTNHPPPQWVADIVRDVCAAAGVPEPTISWRKSKARYDLEWSGGDSNSTRRHINIWYGRDPVDQKLVVLHELAHQLAPANDSHSKAFWEIAYDLYERYGLARYASERREIGYMATAVRVAYARGHLTMEERDDLLLCHRLADSARPKGNPRWRIKEMNAAKARGTWPIVRQKWEQRLAGQREYLRATAEDRRRPKWW